VRQGSRDHPEVHVVAGCVVNGTDTDGRESVERVVDAQAPMFWGHYRVAPDGAQLWLADYDDREAAIDAAKAQARRRPIYLEHDGILTLVSGAALRGRPA
jgi:hypothetical protein